MRGRGEGKNSEGKLKNNFEREGGRKCKTRGRTMLQLTPPLLDVVILDIVKDEKS